MLSEQAISDIEELTEILSRIKSGNLGEMYGPAQDIEEIKMNALSMMDYVFTEATK